MIETYPYYEQLEPLDVTRGLSSVRLMRRDIHELGYVSPETWQRVEDDELSDLAEKLDAPNETVFDLDLFGGELCARDRQKTPFSQMLTNGLAWANTRAGREPLLGFEITRAQIEQEEGRLINAMARGETDFNTMVVAVPFPKEVTKKPGGAEALKGSYKPDREMGFWRVIHSTETGVRIESFSVDQADKHGFASVLEELNVQTSNVADDYTILAQRAVLRLTPDQQNEIGKQLVGRFDTWLATQKGGEWRAGRNIADEVNAWSFVRGQEDLKQYFFGQLHALAESDFNDAEIARMKEELSYSAAARLKYRYEGKEKLFNGCSIGESIGSAGDMAHSEGISFSSCGGGSNVVNNPNSYLFSLISGEKLNCVTCPFCARVVNLPPNKYAQGILECVECKMSVNRYTGSVMNSKGNENDAPIKLTLIDSLNSFLEESRIRRERKNRVQSLYGRRRTGNSKQTS